MKVNRSVSSLIATASVALATLGMTGATLAQNVNWSVGVFSPGVNVGVTNVQPIYYQEPVYQQVYQPVYRAPRRVIYVQPEPVFVVPPQYVQAGWQYPGYGGGWRHGRGRHDGDRFDEDRFEGGRSGHGHRGHDRD